MANLKSSQKDIRRTKKRTDFNLRLRKRLKKAKKTLETALTGGKKDVAEKAFMSFQKVADKAAKKGIIKKQTSSRRKSRIAKKINNISARDAKTN